MKTKHILLIIMISILLLTSCRQVDRVSHNVSREADDFNVTRRLAVINMRSDKPILDLVGKFSISTNKNAELEVTVKTGEDTYKKHFVYLNLWTMYVVEDVSGAEVTPYQYEIHYVPEMIVPFTVK